MAVSIHGFDIGVAAFIAELRHPDGLSVAGDEIISLLQRFREGPVLIVGKLVVALQAEDREPDEVDIVVAGIIGLEARLLPSATT